MAEDAVDEAIKAFDLAPTAVTMQDISGSRTTDNSWVADGQCCTRHLRLVGSHGFSNSLPMQLTETYGFDSDIAYHLATNYGDRSWDVAAAEFGTLEQMSRPASRLSPNFPFIDGEIRHGVRQECAQTASDILARRTRLAFLDVYAALEALPKVIDVMADELKWTEARKQHEWTESVHFLKSMGLPVDKMGITRAEVMRGQLRARKPEQKSTAETVRLEGGLPRFNGVVMARDSTMLSAEDQAAAR